MLKLSTRQKREIYSVSSLLLHLLVFIILLVSLNSCTQKEDLPEVACDKTATVKDMRSMGGCGYMLVLDNGVMLQPMFRWTCIMNKDEQTSIENFKLQDGQRVRFGYKESKNTLSACNMGQTIEITCLELLDIETCWPAPDTKPAN